MDTTQYVRITERFDRINLQCLRDTVRLVFSDLKPSRGNTAYHMLSGDDPILQIDSIDTSIWALATSPNSSLIITNISNLLKTFGSVVNLNIPAGERYSLRIEKNANVAVQTIRAIDTVITVSNGLQSGELIALTPLVSSDGVNVSDFAGVLEVYDGPSGGDILFVGEGLIDEEFYPDGNFTIELYNPSDVTINTNVSVILRQLSITGVYVILEPDTQLEPTTEMSTFNGAN